MDLDQLRELLDELADDGYPGDTLVDLAFQPTYGLVGPLQVVLGIPRSDDQPARLILAGSATNYLDGEADQKLKAEGWQLCSSNHASVNFFVESCTCPATRPSTN